jgi:hypothetical protein
VEAGDQDPEQAEESQNKERVVQPENTAGISSHPNACSDEHLFERKALRRHKRITRSQKSEVRSQIAQLLLATVTLLFAAGCLPDPQRLQSVALLDQLATARTMLTQQTPQATDQACTTVGDVHTRLTGEPGLVDVRPAWASLNQATQALQAACGQNTMLAQPSTDSVAVQQAHERWQNGIQREMSTACDHLREAATALDRARPC